MNICVWDAQFSAGCQNPVLLWPFNSLAHSLASLRCLFFFTFSRLSFVISQYVHGCSLPCLSASHCSVHAHINTCQQNKCLSWYLGNFAFSATWGEVQRCKADVCLPYECLLFTEKNTIIGSWHTAALCTLNSNNETKVFMDTCDETMINTDDGRIQLENKT